MSSVLTTCDTSPLGDTVLNVIQNRKTSEMDNAPDSFQLFNLWQFGNNDDRYGVDYPGRIPGRGTTIDEGWRTGGLRSALVQPLAVLSLPRPDHVGSCAALRYVKSALFPLYAGRRLASLGPR